MGRDLKHDTLVLKAHSASDGRDAFILVSHSPFFIGRRPENDVQLSRPEISGRHAMFRFENGAWLVSDQQSTNGTFLNGKRIDAERVVRVGDTVHFATHGYQAIPAAAEPEPAAMQTQVLGLTSDIQRTMSLITIINEERTFPHFQPVVGLENGRTMGWEALGRGADNRGPMGADSLFGLAGQNRVELKLSQQFRSSASYCAACRFCWPKETGRFLFVNFHPAEARGSALVDSLEELSHSGLSAWYQVVVEISESWVGNVQEVRELTRQIRGRGLKVAYDDFGTGQSRISDLLEVPPDFLKFDRRLIAELAELPVKQGLVRAVVKACRDLGVRTIAEGIENDADRTASRDLGIDFGQGFGLGRPMRAYEMFGVAPVDLPKECLFVQLELLGSNGER